MGHCGCGGASLLYAQLSRRGVLRAAGLATGGVAAALALRNTAWAEPQVQQPAAPTLVQLAEDLLAAEVASKRANLEQAQASLENAESAYRRATSLSSSGALSQSDVDKLRAERREWLAKFPGLDPVIPKAVEK